MKLTDFPRIKRDTCATRNGNFYVLRGSHWYKMELYLPCATGTLSEPLTITAQRFLDAIEDGSKPFKFAITESGNYDASKQDKNIAKWFAGEVI